MVFKVDLEYLNQFAAAFWNFVNGYRVFAFSGPMGAGKTTIIEALCRAKGVTETMSSPTFSIINQYNFTAAGTEHNIYHIDLYRLKDEAEVIQAGVEDCLYSDAVCFVEWPQIAPNLFDAATTVQVTVNLVGEAERMVKIALPSGSVEEQS